MTPPYDSSHLGLRELSPSLILLMLVVARRERITRLEVNDLLGSHLHNRLIVLLPESFNLFIKDTHCKHLVLGCCHDNGYAVILDPYKHDPASKSRITLLHGSQLGKEYTNLPFNTIKLNGIFREAALASSSNNQQARSGDSFTIVPSRLERSHEHVNSGVSDTTAVFTRAVYPRHILLNVHDERVDAPFPEPRAEDWTNFNQRIKQQKLCNDYTLKGHCDNQKCVYAHIPDLHLGEVWALAKRVRFSFCTQGSKCRSADCVYGHVCPHGDVCPRGNKCSFKKVHGKDARPETQINVPSLHKSINL